MPDPGSHKYDVKRTRLRADYDERVVPDHGADREANRTLQREYPPRPLGDPDRAAGPKGTRGTSRGDPALDDPPRPTAGQLELRSSAFNDHAPTPERFAYAGGNVSPPFEWHGVPDGTEELVLLCEDPDAPTGTFTHWVVTTIPPETSGVDEGAVPTGGTEGRNDFGGLGWGGPHPPTGDEAHRYFFRLYAVDRPLGLAQGVTSDDVHAALDDHVLARGTHVGLFGR